MTEKLTAAASTSKRANQSIASHQELLNEDRNAIYFSRELFTQPSKAPLTAESARAQPGKGYSCLCLISYPLSLSICYPALSKRSWLFCPTWRRHLHVPDKLQDERAEQFTTAKSTKGQIRLHPILLLCIRQNLFMYDPTENRTSSCFTTETLVKSLSISCQNQHAPWLDDCQGDL